MARRWEPADTVVALSAGLLVIIFAIFAFLVWKGYDQTIAQAEAKAQTGADVVATETQWMVGSGLLFLRHLEQDIGGDPTAAGPRKAALDTTIGSLPGNPALALYDAAGTVVPGAGAAGQPQSLAGADYFQALSAGKDWIISMQQSEGGAGTSLLVIAKRLDGGGRFSGVAVLTLGGDLLKTFWAPQNLGPDSTVSLIRGDGWVIARYPPLPAPLNLSAAPVFATLKAAESGTYLSPSSPADGVARVVAFRQVPGLDLISLASVSQEAVLAALWTAMNTVLLLMAPIAIVLLAGSFLTARLLRQSERTRRNLAAALAHNQVLFREIHHRVKNNLQSVAALLQMQPIPHEIKAEMGQRIAAMSAVHEHIYRSNNFSTVHVREYLRTLIQNIRDGHDPKVKVIEELEDVAVDKDTAAPLGLILNEVVSNAFKHAFVDGRDGVVTVRLTRESEATGRLSVEDNGVGFDPGQQTKGIGRRLIAALTEQLGGESNFASAAGSQFTLTFPLVE